MKSFVLGLFLIAVFCCGAFCAPDFRVDNGIWLYGKEPFFSTTAHAIFHKFRHDREGAIEDLRNLKKAGFTIVESYWDWKQDLREDGSWNFSLIDDFTRECAKIGLKTFCMLAEAPPIWLAEKMGWSHDDEEGNPSRRIDDFYVCDPSYTKESKAFYDALLYHLKNNKDVSDNILYFNIGGEYKPFRPHRQPRDVDYGYDKHTVAAFRDWLKAKGWTPKSVEERWGVEPGSYKSWEDVWPAVNLKNTDFKGRILNPRKVHAARWDWYDFRQEVATQHFENVIKWIREAGDERPLIHEYNIITPGGLPMFLRWNRIGARLGKDGIHLATGTFDREFDYHGVLWSLAICRGASSAPWQSNEQKGNTTPEWMMKHAWLLIGMGGTGMHFWDWRSDDWGVVKQDGSPSPGYISAVRLNAEFDFYGDLLKRSRPMPTKIGVLTLAEENFAVPRAHEREITTVIRALLEGGWGCETAVITDDEVLDGHISDYQLIICPSQTRMRREIREKLADFVKNGGTLWMTPNTAVKDELDQDLPVVPGEPLDKVAGVIPAIGAVSVSPTSESFGELMAIAERSFSPNTAQAIRYIGNSLPVLFKNKFGKGFCYYQTAYTAYLPGKDTPLTRDPEGLAAYLRSNSGQIPKDVLNEALSEQKMPPFAKIFDGKSKRPLENVMAGIRKAEPGYLLFLIEGDNRTSKATVALDAGRLALAGNWVAYNPKTLEKQTLKSGSYNLQIDLNPAETKVLHILPEVQADNWLAFFKQRNWKSIEATLPPIPEKTLLPPSEIGKVNPGDLKNVKPEPYGNNWLLLDLSKHANRSLIDEGKMEQAKSFLGNLSVGDNDLSELPVGIQEFNGVPFKILDPKENDNSCLITKTNGRPWLGPLEFKGIPLRSKVRRVHWLYGSGWAPDGLPIAYVTYNYSDGTKSEENIICGRNINNWWGYAGPPSNPKLKLAWSGSTPAARRNFTQVGLYQYAWENPHPEKTVENIDITSYGGDACLITVAITGEK